MEWTETLTGIILGILVLAITLPIAFIVITNSSTDLLTCPSGSFLSSNQCITNCPVSHPLFNSSSTTCYNITIIPGNTTINFNDNDVILYYSFDTDTTDDGFRGIDGIDQGTTLATGKIGNARYFNYTNITIPDLSLLAFRNHDFTMTYWVNKTPGVGDQMVVFTSCRGCLDSGYYAGILPTLVLGWGSGTENFFASDDGASWIANALPMGMQPVDFWDMYAIIGNGTNLKVYQGNVLTTDVPYNYNFPYQNGTNMMLGSQAIGFGGNMLQGKVDEFIYLNRSISQEELDCLYNAGVGQSIMTPTDCTGYYIPANTTIINNINTTSSPSEVQQSNDNLRKGLKGIPDYVPIIIILVIGGMLIPLIRSKFDEGGR